MFTPKAQNTTRQLDHDRPLTSACTTHFPPDASLINEQIVTESGWWDVSLSLAVKVDGGAKLQRVAQLCFAKIMKKLTIEAVTVLPFPFFTSFNLSK